MDLVLGLLFGDIGSPNHHKWCFISDQQKGLLLAFKEVAPTVEHRFCVRHLHGNFSKLHKGKQLKDAMWDAARATTVVDWTKEMNKIKGIDKAAYTYLMALQPNWWTRSAFSTFCKCDALLNNMCESFNGYILEAREKPIIKMLEMVKEALMMRIQEKRKFIKNVKGPICPNIQSKLELLKFKSRKCLLT
ncbi:hypothetical protein L1049_006153 [Liquidambar formosana]|uniref:MULE transposase domain-containing protein n=1 Tax=Liquidambar formosana TaxID=63359 RepID=A0AAP0RGK1_LIQFO